MGETLRPRDFVGYGRTLPQFEWPDQGRLALDLVINYEEGAERSPLDGDTAIDEMSDIGTIPTKEGARQVIIESSYEYGSRVGIWRLIELLDRHGFTATVFASGLALERNLEVADAIRERGYEVAGHGYRWIPYGPLGEDGQRADIRRAVESIESTTGQRIRGWFTRGPQALETRALLVQEGFLYDSDACNDDLPYFEQVEGRPFLVVPYSLTTNDWMFWAGAFKTGRDFEDYCRDAFDVLYRESAEIPRMMSVGLHPRIIGQPGRFASLERFLAHVREHDGVWAPGRTTIATFWATRFAPDDLWNWGDGDPATVSDEGKESGALG